MDERKIRHLLAKRSGYSEWKVFPSTGVGFTDRNDHVIFTGFAKDDPQDAEGLVELLNAAPDLLARDTMDLALSASGISTKVTRQAIVDTLNALRAGLRDALELIPAEHQARADELKKLLR